MADESHHPGRYRPRHRWRGRQSVALLCVLTLTALLGLVWVPTASSQAATTASCGYGTGGYEASTLCWLDMTNYSETQARTVAGQQMSVGLPGGFTLTFTVNSVPVGASTYSPLNPVAFPTWSGAYVGNQVYKNTPGRPAMYQTRNGGTTQVTLSNIALTDSGGNPATGYGFVVGDAESTDNGESLAFSSDKALNQIIAAGAQQPCSGGLTGLGTTQVLCKGGSASGSNSALLVQAITPTTISAILRGGGLQGVAFAVVTSNIQLNKVVAGRINATDSFTLAAKTPAGTTFASASTGSANTATTGNVGIPTFSTGSYTLSEAATAGTPTLLSSYTPSWACTLNGAALPVTPSADGSSVQVKPGIGDSVSCTVTNTVKPTGISLTKTAGTPIDTNRDGVLDAGDTVPYTFQVTNTGALTLTGVTVNDPKVTPVTCTATTLAPAASTTCTGSYVLTQADLDAGKVVNTASANGTPPGASAPITSAPASATAPLAPQPGLSLTKSASPSTVSSAGQRVGYGFAVTNTGNVTVTGLGVADTFTAPAGPVPTITCVATTLAPGASTTCSGSYPVTQADLDTGSITNSAVVTGRTPAGATVTSNSSQAVVAVSAMPALTLVKTASPSTVSAAGQQVTYSFLVTNTGNQTASNLTIADTMTAPAGAVGAISCPVTTLAPGASTTCTATYAVSQADVDSGSIHNSATARATSPAGTAITSLPATATVTAPAAPRLTLVKSASPATVTSIGQPVAYRFAVTNSGNVTLTGLQVADSMTAPAGPLGTVSCPVTTLAPGASTTCTASYAVTAADLDNGSIANSATASGTAPSGSGVTSNTSSATVTATRTPALTLTKTASPTTATAAGQRITYSFAVTNSGNVTLTGLGITDTFASPGGPAPAISCPVSTLAAGASTTCTASYAVSQADVDHGSVQNTATAAATGPGGASITSNTSSATVTIAPAPDLTLVKSASPTTVSAVGQQVSYRFAVTNTGNVTVSGIGITDTLTAPAGPVPAVSCPLTTLAPAASTTCTGVYTVTQADLDAGSIGNSAVSTGRSPAGAAVSSTPSTAVVGVVAGPALTLVKSASPTTVSTAGQPIAYRFLVTNSGNQTLSSLAVADAKTGPVNCPVTTLAPGASTTCTAGYAASQADVDAGRIVNTATASALSPAGTAVTSLPSTATVTAAQAPGLSLVKSASPVSVATVGQAVSYSFLVTNTGNVTLDNLGVVDAMAAPAGPLGPISCPASTLAPGAATTCTASYSASAADLDHGSITNSAHPVATTPGGTAVTGNTSSATVSATQTPALALTKTATPTSVSTVGQPVAYSFAVTNTGNVTISGLSVADTLTAPAGPVPAISCPVTSLAGGAQTVCTATYPVTQADLDAGRIVNSATVSGTTPGGATVTSPPSRAVVTVAQTPTLSLVKSATPTTITAAGQPIGYSFLVTNTGNVTITGVHIADAMTAPAGSAGAISCPVTTLAPGASTTCTASYRASQADVDNGSVANVATAGGTTPGGGAVSSNSSAAVVTAAGTASLTMVKTANPTTVSHAGQVIQYSFATTNTGDVTLSLLAIRDTLAPPAGPALTVSCPQPTLAPGTTVTCTASYTVTQADLDSGAVSNSAVATAQDPTGATITSPPSDATSSVAAAPSLSIVKSAAPTTVSAVGQVVVYSFVVTNTGNVTVSQPGVSDTMAAPAGALGPISCPAQSLAPGQRTMCTADYAVTQADLDNGSISNSATATGTDPAGHPVPPPAPSTATVAVTQTATLSLVKTASPTTVSTLGQPVAYSFAVTNTGNVTVTGLGVSDAFTTPPGDAAPVVSCPVTTVAPGATVTCTATHPVTQADLDAATIRNTATATGTAPGGAVTSNPASATVQATQTPQLSLVKTASPGTVTAVGQLVTYRFVVTNTGNVTVSQPAVLDTPTAPAGPAPTVSCPAGALAPGAAVTCTAGYTVTQADVDNGAITNSALATAAGPNGSQATSNDSSAVVAVTATPALTLTKTASPTTISRAGQTVSYTFAVSNTGNVTLSLLSINDQLAAPAGPQLAVTCPVRTLAPGAGTTCAGSYLATQADVDNGSISNTATASAHAPSGATITSPGSDATVTAQPTPTLTLAKTASPVSVTAAGQLITYGFVVTNTGTVTVSGIAVSDAFSAPAGPGSAPSCPGTTLAPAASMTCTSTYVATQDDLDAGSIANTGTATGTSPAGPPPPATSSAAVTAQQHAALTVLKSATPSTVTATGQPIDYTFTVTNTGNVTVDDLAIADTMSAPAGPMGTISCPDRTLAPAAVTTCTGSYPASQADVDHGSIVNTATATGTDPAGQPVVSPPSAVTVTAPAAPGLTLVKAADPATVSAAGQPVSYTFTVTNTGNVTLSAVSVSDQLAAPAGPPVTVDCPATPLAPGASTSCTAGYTVTQADVDNGSIDNSATATANPPAGPAVTSAPSTATVGVDQTAGLTVVKSVSPGTISAAGTRLSYAFLVTNTGNVTVRGLAVTDQPAAPAGAVGPVSCPVTTLAPGASTSCTVGYTVTQADVDHGSIVDTATASAVGAGGQQLTATSNTATVTVSQQPLLTLRKSADPTTVSRAGTQVQYAFLVTNAGNVTITGLGIADTMAAPAGAVGPLNCPATTLAPGAATTCTASYTVTQADVDHGSIANTATATGTAAGGPVSSEPSTATVTAPPAAALTLTKTADPTTVTAAGQPVTYRFLVTNTGNVTVSGLAVADTFTAPAGPVPAISCPATTLAPGASTTCTASYTVTQADVDHGSIRNTATATGTAPDGQPVGSPASAATVTVAQSPALTLVKSATPTTVSAVGQQLSYSFAVTNTGNVTLSLLSVADALTAPAGPPLTIDCPVSTLPPAASTTCTASYRVTQADLDAGSVSNDAHATAQDPSGATVTSPGSDATVAVQQTPALTLRKTATPSTVSAVGQQVGYAFLVTNTGNVTVSALAVRDVYTAGTGSASAVSCPTTTLAPGASTTCTSSYTVTQADLDHGSIANTATVTGSAPDGTPASATDSATVGVSAHPSLGLVKAASPTSVSAAGQVIDYTFTITNLGNVTVAAITIADTPSGAGALTLNCPPLTLAPGASASCTGTYTVTQPDVDAGSVTNTATASGTAANGAGVSATSTAIVNAAQRSSLSLVKAASPTMVSAAGQQVDYTFTVTNNGNTTLTGVDVADQLAAPAGPPLSVSCPLSTLPPGVAMSCTASYPVTQVDVDHGSIDNSATASGTDPTGATITSPPSTATVGVSRLPALALVKSADQSAITAAGQPISYFFDVTNTGNVTLTGLAVADAFDSPATEQQPASCPPGPLAPGATVRCTEAYTSTQADVDSGRIANTATASGTDPDGDPVTSPASTLRVPASQRPSLAFLKSASPSTVTAAGQTIDYTFAVTNTGNVTVGLLHVADTLAAPAGPAVTVHCPVTTLAPAAATTCTGTYTVTQADVDAGSIDNTAHAVTQTPSGAELDSPPSSAGVSVAATAGLSITKSASPTTVSAAGQPVSYTFAVTNTGNLTVHAITVDDQLAAPAGPPLSVDCPQDTLTPGAQLTCTASYLVTQADLDHGSIDNSATATGLDPHGTAVGSNTATRDVAVAAEPALTLAKTADPQLVTAAGQPIAYSFVVTNTGNLTERISVTDPHAGLSAISCPATSLAPGESTTCTASYAATQADLNAGAIDNTATVTGTDPHGATVTATSTATVTAQQNARLNLVKSANPTTVSQLGATVDYTFLVSNTGNVTVRGLSITDTMTAPAGATSPPSCPATSLEPGQSTTCTASYTVTQLDLDNGSIANSATAGGQDPVGNPVTSPPSTAEVGVGAQPALQLVKQATVADLNHDGRTDLGDTISWTVVVTNAGNLTLSAITVDDPTAGPVSCPQSSLAPGQSMTCTAGGPHTVTQADVDAGVVTNTVTGTATDPHGNPVTAKPSTVTTPVAGRAALSVVKTGALVDANHDGRITPGDLVVWHLTVTNTGTLTLTGVRVSDPQAGAVSCASDTLAPGAVTSCPVAATTLTQAMIDAGSLTNTATATGTPPSGPVVTAPPSTATVPLPAAPGLSLVKRAVVTPAHGHAGPPLVGDQVSWTITVTNAGNTTLTAVAVSDPTGGPVSCPATSLAPGAAMVCDTPTRTLTRTGTLVNVATGSASAGGRPTSALGTAAVSVLANTPPASTGVAHLPGLLELAGLLLIVGGLTLVLSRRRRRD